MKKITIKEATDKILGAFDLVPFGKQEPNKSFYGEDKEGVHFVFDDSQYTRDDVEEKICKMFSGITIDGGWLAIDPSNMGRTFVDIHKEDAEED